jgi:HTH-type transcriptional regulator/antitoxin HigA
MTLKQIKTAKVHKNALARVYELMQQEPRAGSIEADELEKVALMVSDYEDKHFPVPPPEHTNNR